MYSMAPLAGISYYRLVIVGWITIGLVTSGSGCSCSPTPPPGPPTLVDVWLQTIEEGDVDQATNVLLLNPDMFDTHKTPEVFTTSEDEYAGLSYSRQNEMMDKAIYAANQIKTFSRAMLEKAAQLESEGQTEEAARYRQAIIELGQSLNTTERLLMLQMIGQAIQSAAQQPMTEEAPSPEDR